MDPGYVVDLTYGAANPAQWAPGFPQKRIWGGLKLDKDQMLNMTTFRCRKCGCLESYALAQGE